MLYFLSCSTICYAASLHFHYLVSHCWICKCMCINDGQKQQRSVEHFGLKLQIYMHDVFAHHEEELPAVDMSSCLTLRVIVCFVCFLFVCFRCW